MLGPVPATPLPEGIEHGRDRGQVDGGVVDDPAVDLGDVATVLDAL